MHAGTAERYHAAFALGNCGLNLVIITINGMQKGERIYRWAYQNRIGRETSLRSISFYSKTFAILHRDRHLVLS